MKIELIFNHFVLEKMVKSGKSGIFEAKMCFSHQMKNCARVKSHPILLKMPP